MTTNYGLFPHSPNSLSPYCPNSSIFVTLKQPYPVKRENILAISLGLLKIAWLQIGTENS